MSTIRVDNFGPSSGGTSYSARGIAKAWVNFNGTGTIAARDSENVSSLTDNGTGDYTVNIGNDMANASYMSVVYPTVSTSTHSSLWANQYVPTASTLSFAVENQVGTSLDVEYVNMSLHGDLA